MHVFPPLGDMQYIVCVSWIINDVVCYASWTGNIVQTNYISVD